jgi:hypothetical protein
VYFTAIDATSAIASNIHAKSFSASRPTHGEPYYIPAQSSPFIRVREAFNVPRSPRSRLTLPLHAADPAVRRLCAATRRLRAALPQQMRCDDWLRWRGRAATACNGRRPVCYTPLHLRHLCAGVTTATAALQNRTVKSGSMQWSPTDKCRSDSRICYSFVASSPLLFVSNFLIRKSN